MSTSSGTSEALARTLLLIQGDHFPTERVGRTDIAELLICSRIRVSADAVTSSTLAGQAALVTLAQLLARMGMTVVVDAPNVPLVRRVAPLRERRLLDALIELGHDLIPGVAIEPPGRAQFDASITIGPGSSNGHANWWVSARGTQPRLTTIRSEAFGSRREDIIGVLKSCTLAAGEVFKLRLRQLEAFADNRIEFRRLMAPTLDVCPPAISGAGIPAVLELGHYHAISAGAITNAALYVLQWLVESLGQVRLYDADTTALSNLNRYMLLRRSAALGQTKVSQLREVGIKDLEIIGMPIRLAADSPELPMLRDEDVLVGVDDIPSRWVVQTAEPGWLGIGATSHYDAYLTTHEANMPCAHCGHPHDHPLVGEIPTVSFVSFWAGLVLAEAYLSHAGGKKISAANQSAYWWLLRPDAKEFPWYTPIRPLHSCRRCSKSH